jgi:hypothetical protein
LDGFGSGELDVEVSALEAFAVLPVEEEHCADVRQVRPEAVAAASDCSMRSSGSILHV